MNENQRLPYHPNTSEAKVDLEMCRMIRIVILTEYLIQYNYLGGVRNSNSHN